MERLFDRWFFVIRRQRHAFMRETLKCGSLEPRMLPFLYHVRQTQGLRQEDLSAATGLDKTTVAHAVKKLVGLGLLSRTRDCVDRRCYRLSLTEEGAAMCDSLDETFRAWSAGLSEGFSEEELEILEGFLRRMADNAQKMNGGS